MLLIRTAINDNRHNFAQGVFMKILTGFLIFIFSLEGLACSAGAVRQVNSTDMQMSLNNLAGGRFGLHGMVIFGNGSYFIEHIPMLHPPHDVQMVAQVVIKNKSGKILKPDLSQEGFTLKPTENFALNDLLNNQLNSFQAMLFQGSFESNGKIVIGYNEITIEIVKVLLARSLPATAQQSSVQMVDIAGNTYETELITPQNNRQFIKNITNNKKLWCVVGPDFFESCL